MATERNRGLDYLYRYGRPGCLLCGLQEFSVGKEHCREEAPEGMKMVMIVCSYCGFAMTVNSAKMPRYGT
jgi:ribosomal protein L37E